MDENVLPPTVRAVNDPREPDATWTLLPVDTSKGQCSQCGRTHPPEQPHDRERLAYQYAFFAEHDRWPTWRDSMAHCTPEVRAFWVGSLAAMGVDVDG